MNLLHNNMQYSYFRTDILFQKLKKINNYEYWKVKLVDYSVVMKCCPNLNNRTATYVRRPPSECPKRSNGFESLSQSESSNLDLCDIWASQECYMFFSLPREL